MDDARGPPKRIRRSRQSHSILARSSGSSSNSRNTNGVAIRDNASLPSLTRGSNLAQELQPISHVQAPNRNGSSLESASVGFQRYLNETVGIRFSHRSPSFPRQHRRYGHPTIPMRGVPPNPPHDAAIPPQEIVTLDDEVENSLDPYREMRLNIEDMSYEELLALGESIGSVSTSLSEETITSLLKTKAYPISIDLEKLPSDQESDACIICQEDFEYQERVGILACDHAFHVGCITQWLLIKNECPICKSEALTPIKVS